MPEKVIDNEILKVEDEFKHSISKMGLDFEEYLSKIKKTKEELREGWREQARDRVEISLLLSAVAEKEEIRPEDREVEEEANKALKQFSNVEEAKKSINSSRLHSYVYGIIKNEKTFKFLENL